MKIKTVCDMCGKEVFKYPSQIKKHNFCSRQCLSNFSSKRKNPRTYATLKDYNNISRHMTELNRELNPTRMDFPTRAKLSVSMRKDSGKGYTKSFGAHAHRKIAERKLGRKLRRGEVVHHIDGDKRNNSPDNLQVFKNQAEHAKWHAIHRGGDAT